MAPVILRMDVHCYGCAGKIRRVVKNLLGVEEVWVSVDTGLVVVGGTSLDASLLRWRIQTRTRRPVTVVSDGADPEPEPPQPQYQYAAPPPGYPQHYHYSGMQYMGPPPTPPTPTTAAAPAPQHLLQYVPTTTWDGYFPSRQYVPNQAPVCFNDDNPNGCCAVQ
ncbi:unnamed protein product [Miscanthus lutarioriparius]|uniref:HMA domain-containing protein n=1 Tax=Miscanthus lutarioriparius TaxID=422564 RepID=A0A811N3U1_9POAL|nr:unnamed protein product [Miscanthus lutarioriparius]